MQSQALDVLFFASPFLMLFVASGIILYKNIRLWFLIVVFILSYVFVLIPPTGGWLGDIETVWFLIACLITSGVSVLILVLTKRLLVALIISLAFLGLPLFVAVRDVYPGDYFIRCEINAAKQSLDLYKSRHGSYPSSIYDEEISSYLEEQHRCERLPKRWFYQYLNVRPVLLYDQQDHAFLLGGYYRHYILSLVHIRRVCMYDPGTTNITCGFNTWGPFTPR